MQKENRMNSEESKTPVSQPDFIPVKNLENFHYKKANFFNINAETVDGFNEHLKEHAGKNLDIQFFFNNNQFGVVTLVETIDT